MSPADELLRRKASIEAQLAESRKIFDTTENKDFFRRAAAEVRKHRHNTGKEEETDQL